MATQDGSGYRIRCPRLGGEVTFRYCRWEQGDLPCPRVIRCWEGRFPIEKYLRSALTEEEWAACFVQPPQDKVGTLIELVEAAKRRKADSRQGSGG